MTTAELAPISLHTDSISLQLVQSSPEKHSRP
jgi:hypothetical protein